MAKMGSADFSELKKLQENLNKMVGSEDARSKFCEDCAKELAARLLRSVIKRTPVGVYPASSGKVGGTLRRGWTSERTMCNRRLIIFMLPKVVVYIRLKLRIRLNMRLM